MTVVSDPGDPRVTATNSWWWRWDMLEDPDQNISEHTQFLVDQWNVNPDNPRATPHGLHPYVHSSRGYAHWVYICGHDPRNWDVPQAGPFAGWDLNWILSGFNQPTQLPDDFVYGTPPQVYQMRLERVDD